MSRFFLICLVLLCSVMNTHAGMASYTDRGSIDFDRAMQMLNPYGTWSKIDEKWAYTPLDHQAPYTNGRWLYTEFGWYWKGNAPHSWLTEHYGYWKRGEDKVWSWFPKSSWLPEIVEIRATPTYIGWRSGEVDENGDFVEAPNDRYTKIDEWTYVTRAQFAGPITPGIVVTQQTQLEDLIDDSKDCVHGYLTYRQIIRPGPHPADFVALCKDGGMFSPLQNMVMEHAPGQPLPSLPPPMSPHDVVVMKGSGAGAAQAAASAAATNAPAANSPASHMTGVVQPSLAGTGADADPLADTRQVKYWVTMCLPTYWTPRPEDAKPQELYIYRPDFFQDDDGIQRRVTLWFDPHARTSLKEVLASSTPVRKTSASAPDAGGSPAVPAAPPAAKSHDPFRSPLDASFTPPAVDSATADASSKTNAEPTVAPSGLATESSKTSSTK